MSDFMSEHYQKLPMQNTVTLEELKLHGQTGDIIFWKTGGMFQTAIRIFNWSNWNHIAILYVEPGTRHLYAIESTEGTYPRDILSNSYKSGPKLSNFEKVVTKIKYLQIGYRKLKGQRGDNWNEAAVAFANSMNHYPYEVHAMELVKSVLGANSSENLDGIFCVELVAMFYKHVGLLDDSSKYSNNYTFADFTGQTLKLCKGFKFSKTIKTLVH